MRNSTECMSQRRMAPSGLVRRFKSLEKRYPSASQSLLSIVDQAIVSGTSFLSAAIIGRLTTPDQLGLYYLVLSIVIVAIAVQDSVLSAPYQVYCRRREGRELNEYTGSLWVHHFVLYGLVVVGLLATIGVVSMAGESNVLPGIWILLGAAPLILLRQAVRRFTFANLHVRSAIALDVVVAAVQLGGLVLLGYFGWLNLAGIFAVMGGACGLACVGLYSFDPPAVRFARERFVPDWRLNWAFGRWSLRTYLVGNTTPSILLWILGVAVGAAAAGVYGACATLVGVANVLLFGVDNVLTPQATHAYTTGGAPALRRILFRTAMFLAITLVGFCLFVAFTGEWLMVLVFGASGEGTGAIVAVLALCTLMYGMGIVAGNGLWAIDQPRANFRADASCMAVTLAAALLILPFGALGAALANLAGMAAATVVRSITLTVYLRRAAVVNADRKSRGGALSDSEALSNEELDTTCLERGHRMADVIEAAV